MIALPFGFATDFIHYNPKPGVGEFLATFAGVFFFIALPEEILFRGLLQNILQQTIKSQALALTIAAVLFGIAACEQRPDSGLALHFPRHLSRSRVRNSIQKNRPANGAGPDSYNDRYRLVSVFSSSLTRVAGIVRSD